MTMSHPDAGQMHPTRQHSSLLLNVRDARGDRVVHAQEFLRPRGLAEDFEEREYPVYWIAELQALAVPGVL